MIMASLKLVTACLLAFSLLPQLGCSSGAHREGTGEYIDDSVLTARVKAAILGEKSLSVAEINVETFKGEVQLSGFVNSQQDIDTALRLTRAISGVSTVKNDMRVK
jgi:hyperosmotically inducible protein